MENKLTAVQWILEHDYLMKSTKWKDIVEQALQMEREQHGETWDMALKQMVERGYVWVRASTDFDDYWEKRNAPISEGIDQPGLPDGMDNSTTPPGEHCKEA